ncbi:hypothetical protein [Mumia zhuanghuii]|uniref:Uncharacterized protein n=1 Tax=Mumia zhuanghuii TaxID=2585211 RepID=A0A5C4MDW5_9ACTN|nr:hypothetical protein [Mumia zhuanghuii]TNC39067.1 hypothetical protein FHE65_24010 [Mumia zhuanghuii]TNC47099.1 hypothetical protein FHE65_10795 [Mumia zhuanghuii]
MTTFDDVPDGSTTGTARWTTRVTLMVLLVVVVAGAAGLFGVRNATATTEDAGWTLSVDYPRLARSGLDTPLSIVVSNPEGVGEEVVVALSQDYLTIFEHQGIFPDPSDTSTDGEFLYLTVAAAPGATEVRIDFDVYVQPSSQEGEQATVFLLDGDERVASTRIRTTLMP